jgi:uncharacterized membrane protein HdeD (DUF308 family)
MADIVAKVFLGWRTKILRAADAFLALVWVIGTYAVIIGGVFVVLAFRLKKHAHS